MSVDYFQETAFILLNVTVWFLFLLFLVTLELLFIHTLLPMQQGPVIIDVSISSVLLPGERVSIWLNLRGISFFVFFKGNSGVSQKQFWLISLKKCTHQAWFVCVCLYMYFVSSLIYSLKSRWIKIIDALTQWIKHGQMWICLSYIGFFKIMLVLYRKDIESISNHWNLYICCQLLYLYSIFNWLAATYMKKYCWKTFCFYMFVVELLCLTSV